MRILEILKSEPIRLADGRWSQGYVDEKELRRLIDTGVAEVYDNQGMTFVRGVR